MRPFASGALTALLTLAFAGALPQAASAAPTPEAEPNDSIFQATGPIGADGVVGAIGTVADRDVFLVRLRPQRQIKITYSVAAVKDVCVPDYVKFALVTAGGAGFGAGKLTDSITVARTTGIAELALTTPGIVGDPSSTHYLHVWTSASSKNLCQYSVRVTGTAGEPTDVIDTTPPLAFPFATVPEPNDLPEQAFGPLTGDVVYVGNIETENDVDYLALPVMAGHPATFELGAINGAVQADVSVSGASRRLIRVEANSGTEQTGTVAAADADRPLLVKVTGKVGAEWRLRATPPVAIGVTPAVPWVPDTTPAPLTRVKRQVSLNRVSGRYRGRVTASRATCKRNVRVTLRRKGSRRSYGTTRTRADGSWTIRRSPLKGRAYVSIKSQVKSGYRCSADRSRTLKRVR